MYSLGTEGISLPKKKKKVWDSGKLLAVSLRALGQEPHTPNSMSICTLYTFSFSFSFPWLVKQMPAHLSFKI